MQRTQFGFVRSQDGYHRGYKGSKGISPYLRAKKVRKKSPSAHLQEVLGTEEL